MPYLFGYADAHLDRADIEAKPGVQMLDPDGRYRYRWESSSPKIAEEGSIIMLPSAFGANA